MNNIFHIWFLGRLAWFNTWTWNFISWSIKYILDLPKYNQSAFCRMISQLHKIATYVPSMWNTYVLTISLYPNTRLDLFCSDNLFLLCMAPNMWLTNFADPNTWLQSLTREGCWLQSSLVHHSMKIKKLIGHKTLRCTNTATSSQERWTRANFVSGHNLLEQNFAQHLCNLCHLWRSLK